ncbi:MAG: YggS family pyridoxal phosphate-dependent enzyme [Actinomycetota bacterium]
MADARTAEIAANLADVRERIANACTAAGRDPREITLVVVTKTWPADDVVRLAELGVTDVGENRDQEAAPKADATRELDLTWHFIGQLQTNKAAAVARYADVVHSVDRLALVQALEKGAAKAGRTLDCLVQVNLDPDATPETGAPGHRGGAAADEVADIAAAIGSAEHLRLRGVMGVAPLGADPAPPFARLADALAALRVDYPALDVMSAGMSDDLEQAVAAGATHLRVGSSVLGSRASRG